MCASVCDGFGVLTNVWFSVGVLAGGDRGAMKRGGPPELWTDWVSSGERKGVAGSW